MRALTVAVLLSACGRTALSDRPIDSGPPPLAPATVEADAPVSVSVTGPPESPPAQPPGCRREVQSSHPLIHFELPEQPCAFTQAELAHGVRLKHRLVVVDGAELADTRSTVPPGTSCYLYEPLGVMVLEHVLGGLQHYCVCDYGLCSAPFELRPRPGSVDLELEWEGRNWLGPADMNAPKGPPFPPGEYRFEVRAHGYYGPTATPWLATGQLSLTILL